MPQPKYELDGKKTTFLELSRRTGIPESTLFYRWKNGKRGADLTTPVDRKAAARIGAHFSRPSQVQNALFDPDEEADMSYEEIAAELGLSVPTVYRIEKLALAKIRQQLVLND